MKHSLVRSTIVETASRLFYENGYNLTGINEIIREAGVAKATLYNHFKSKEEICVAYLQYRNVHFLQQLEDSIKHKSGKLKVLGLFDFLEGFFNQDEFNGCWCLNTNSELPRENERVRVEILLQKNNFLKVIEGLFPKDYNEEQKSQLAKRIYLVYEASISESNLYRELWPITEGRAICENILK